MMNKHTQGHVVKHPGLYTITLIVVATAAWLVTQAAWSELEYYFDIDGSVVVKDTEDPNAPMKMLYVMKALGEKQFGIEFNLFYEDVFLQNGIGFADPVHGPARRAAFERMLEYLNSVLDHTGAVDIFVAASMMDPFSGLLASASGAFNGTPGFSNGHPFTRITTGVDPNGPANAEMFVRVNFGQNYYAGEAPTPGSNQFDLFTVLLHEVTHGLGILSLAGPSGASLIAPGVYSGWDRFLARNAGAFLFSDPGAMFVGSPFDLTSNDLILGSTAACDSFGACPPVFAPANFQQGSSLSHFNLGIAGGAVMEPSIAPGRVMRAYAPVELAALAALGYSVADNGAPDGGNPNPVPDANPVPDPNPQPDGGLPDLTAPFIEVKSFTATEGELFYIIETVLNDSAVPAGASQARLWLSTDNDNNLNNDFLVGERSVPALGPGESINLRFDFTMPDLASGTYLVFPIMQVDSNNDVVESDENNLFRPQRGIRVSSSAQQGAPAQGDMNGEIIPGACSAGVSGDGKRSAPVGDLVVLAVAMLSLIAVSRSSFGNF